MAFIDFAKAYDKVDRGKLWRCLEQLGVNGRFLRLLKALYQDSSCRVRVHDRLSEEFEVGTGLRQGCVKLISDCEVKSSCALLKSKAERRMMLRLRGGTAAFQIEMGRWHGVKREDRICKECDSGEVEEVCHWLLQCSAWDHDKANEDFTVKSDGA